jgi:hypothetical protein
MKAERHAQLMIDLIREIASPLTTEVEYPAPETSAGKEARCAGRKQMFARLIARWVYGGFLAGLLLLLLTPVLVHSWPDSLVATFLCLPVYMVHQYEEHDNDRFRLFVNQKIGKGRVGLSPLAVFVINVPGVWGIIGMSLAGAATVSRWLGTGRNLSGAPEWHHSRRPGDHFPRLQPRTGNCDHLVSSPGRVRYRCHSSGWWGDILHAYDRCGSRDWHSCGNYRPHHAPTT